MLLRELVYLGLWTFYVVSSEYVVSRVQTKEKKLEEKQYNKGTTYRFLSNKFFYILLFIKHFKRII